tara:strand:+ start:2698 stop:2988 length:291 start_codon:yes stop_codon:yes gene_type:complete
MSEKELTPEQQKEQMKALIEQLQNSFNPMDYMTPTQKEIALMSMEQLEAEYLLVQDKKNPRSRMQRDLIESRYEFEQNKLKENETAEADTSNTERD